MIGSAVSFTDGGTTYTINNRAGQPLLHEQSPYYYISVTNIDGLRNADISYESHPIPNATGEKSGDVFKRGKTIAISGHVYGLNLGKMEEGCDYLGQMFNSTALRPLSWTRKSDGIAVYMNCRVNQDLTIVERIEDTSYRWAWLIVLRSDMPFTYRVSNGSVYPTWQS